MAKHVNSKLLRIFNRDFLIKNPNMMQVAGIERLASGFSGAILLPPCGQGVLKE